MSRIDKNNLNYFKTVERFFLSLRDSGLALSASDYQLIGEWEKREIPVELICRAIKSGYSSFEGQRGVKRRNISLTQIQVIVEERIQIEIYKK